MIISIIVAVAKNNAIGKDNKMIWRLSSDLKRFKRLTTGHHILMGRKTFERVCSFDCDWPYNKPLFILSNSMKSIPEGYEGKAEPINSPLSAVIATIHQKGHKHLYIDGGVTVQNFLKEDLIDEIIITIIPTLLGGGTPLFGDLPKKMELEHVNTEVFLNAIVQTHYRRKR